MERIVISRKGFRKIAVEFAKRMAEDIARGTKNSDPMDEMKNTMFAVTCAKGLEEIMFDGGLVEDENDSARDSVRRARLFDAVDDVIRSKISRGDFFEIIDDILGGGEQNE